MKFIFQDWKFNNTKGRIVMLLFRIANIGKFNKVYRFVSVPYRVFYTVLVEWILGIELQPYTKVGEGLVIYHGQSLVVHEGTVIGKNCILRQSTTIGRKESIDENYSASPIIGNNVDVGSNVCIIGGIRIGNNVKIGSGSVVVKDVPDNCTVVGNPAREI